MAMMNIKNKKKQKIDKSAKLFKQLVKRSNKSLSIFEMQKELIQLKIMLRLLLSPEQFAAMQLCGSKKPSKTTEQNEQKKKDELHIQQLDNVKQTEKFNEKENSNEKVNNNEKEKTTFKEFKIPKNSSSVFPLEVDEKLSAIQLINQQSDNIQNNRNAMETRMNHLEKIDMIERDQQFLSECVNKFLQNNNSSSSELHNRILGCMVGLDQDQLGLIDKI